MVGSRCAQDWPVVAEVVRSGFAESRHRGRVVALAADGSARCERGAVSEPIFPRSASKPLQALGMLRAGLDLDGHALALVCASHSGEDFHVEGVGRILSDAGLRPVDLACPGSWPIDQEVKAEHMRAGAGPDRQHHNCSGKHAGMLATCVQRGWPTASYLDEDHPLQQAIRATITDLTEEPIAATGVDGCGAPLFAYSLGGLARAYQHLASSDELGCRRVRGAMRAHPRWTSGTTRDEARLMEGVSGLVAKGGAEGCYAVALADSSAAACKIEDGSQRASPVVMAALLRRLGVDAPAVMTGSTTPILGGDRPVGEIRAVGF